MLRKTDSQHTQSHTTVGLQMGITIILLLILVGILAPVFLAERADFMFERGLGATNSHWLGTDAAGHDMLARTLVATRLSLLMAAAATAFSLCAGIILGAGTWLLPRRAREVSLRLIDTMVSFPPLLLALVVAAVMGPGTASVVLALGIAATPSMARFTANLAAQVSQREFVRTARLMGVPGHRLLRSHLVPNMGEPLLVIGSASFGQALISISALSFVGLGVQSPAYDFGKLLNDSLPAIFSGRPLQIVGPAVMIVLTGFAAMLIGDGLAASSDPRLRGKRKVPPAVSISNWGPPRSANVTAEPGGVTVRNLRVGNTAGDLLVKGISFEVGAGEIVGIVGESGSGKSLTAMSLARLLPDSLTVQADMLQLSALNLLEENNPKDLARELALIYQDPGSTFNPALRLGSQLSEVLRVHRGMSASEARAVVVEGLRTVRISDPERRYSQHPYELSGGMRQRAMIASALACDARVIIADEPTTALDVTVQAEILSELRRINRESGVSILFISHDIDVVRALCHRVLVMQKGKIVEDIAATDLTLERAISPYTRALLAATPTLAERSGP